LNAAALEVAVLERSNVRRCFRRLSDDDVAAKLSSTEASEPTSTS
jgi:hypothetical protein